MDGNLTQNIQKYIPVIGEYANVHLVLKTQISYSSQDLKSNPSGLISAEAACLSLSSLLISAVTHTSVSSILKVLELVGVTAWWLELEPGNGHNAQKLDVQRELTYPADDVLCL